MSKMQSVFFLEKIIERTRQRTYAKCEWQTEGEEICRIKLCW